MAQDNILIIGAGTWGCSIALELARRGHTGITVLDGSDFPSSTSVGNHRNVFAEEAPSQTNLHTLSLQKWRTDPLFSPFYHATPLSTGHKSRLASQSPSFTPPTSAFPSCLGVPNPRGYSWIDTRGVTTALRDEAAKLGVRFLCGKEYEVTRLIYSTSTPSLSGLSTSCNTTYLGKTVILAAGAYSTLLLDFEAQIVPRARGVAYISLEDGEAKQIPLDVLDTGRIVVDGNRGEVQISDQHQGYINPVANTSTYTYASVPFARAQIPVEAEARVRGVLRETLPHLAARPFSHARLVWRADTRDGGVVIDKHPRLGNLVVAVGGRGEVCPVVGGVVADLVEGREGCKAMGWKEGCEGRDIWEGGVVDIGDVAGWTRIGE
ncbi:hypothetical protein HBH53_202370 [Parastagonospora nodorum]|nr:hypothetical protein HBH53_202370 [Parastagonospora nodorum]KAH5342574.1 hypothetical protein HBI48_222430 [Parastagonospora nodorum]KAH5397010.1 hypothetical protein HBI32_196530 [Parastagonospora nodorum]KAH5715079.1 hypothetical protein HBI18_190150 [Parastagonospora nodorum]